MSSTEEVAAAEAKVNSAKNALFNYVEGRNTIDRDRYRRLVERVKKAEAEFLRAVSKLVEC